MHRISLNSLTPSYLCNPTTRGLPLVRKYKSVPSGLLMHQFPFIQSPSLYVLPDDDFTLPPHLLIPRVLVNGLAEGTLDPDYVLL